MNSSSSLNSTIQSAWFQILLTCGLIYSFRRAYFSSLNFNRRYSFWISNCPPRELILSDIIFFSQGNLNNWDFCFYCDVTMPICIQAPRFMVLVHKKTVPLDKFHSNFKSLNVMIRPIKNTVGVFFANDVTIGAATNVPLLYILFCIVVYVSTCWDCGSLRRSLQILNSGAHTDTQTHFFYTRWRIMLPL